MQMHTPRLRTNQPAARTHSHTHTHARTHAHNLYTHICREQARMKQRARTRIHRAARWRDWSARRTNPPTRTRLGVRQACIETNSQHCMTRGASQGTLEIRRVPRTCAAAAATSTSSPAARRARAMLRCRKEGRFAGSAPVPKLTD
jgi:hypothetical protein